MERKKKLIVWPDAETELCFQDADVCRSRKLCLQILLSIDGVPSSPSLLEVAHDGRRKWRPVHNKMTIRQTVAPLLSTSDVWHALRDRFIADARVERKKKEEKRRRKWTRNTVETIEILYRRIFILILMLIIFLRTFRNSFFLIKLRLCKFVFFSIQSEE